MPWSAKAQELLQSQYAAVGAAANAALPHTLDALTAAKFGLNGETAATHEVLLQDFEGRKQSAEKFVTAYRGYGWPVN